MPVAFHELVYEQVVHQGGSHVFQDAEHSGVSAPSIRLGRPTAGKPHDGNDGTLHGSYGLSAFLTRKSCRSVMTGEWRLGWRPGQPQYALQGAVADIPRSPRAGALSLTCSPARCRATGAKT